MSLTESIGWPLVLSVGLPDAGDPLIGATPVLSPDLAPDAWELTSGSIGDAVSVGSWKDPSAPAFFSASGVSTASIDLALPSNRGFACYAGFGRFLPYSDGSVDPAYATDHGMLVEFLDAGASVISSLKVVPGAGGSTSFSLIATAVGASTLTVENVSGISPNWESPWHRTLALAVSDSGAVTAGFGHPALSGRAYGQLGGVSSPSEVKRLRISVTASFGLTFIDVRKRNMASAGPPGIWWRSRVNCIEQGDGINFPENDWQEPI